MNWGGVRVRVPKQTRQVQMVIIPPYPLQSPSTGPWFSFLGPSVPLTPGDTPIRKKELLFDEGDDIMTTLGFEDSPKAERKKTGDQ